MGQGLTDNPVLEATMFFNWRYQLFSAFKFDKFNLKESNVVLLGRGGQIDLSIKGGSDLFSSLSKYNPHLPMSTFKELLIAVIKLNNVLWCVCFAHVVVLLFYSSISSPPLQGLWVMKRQQG